MTDKKTWFITGAGPRDGRRHRQGALAAGNAVVATGVLAAEDGRQHYGRALRQLRRWLTERSR